ncbi:olfactory receptor 2Z1, partial [Sigmodon hispidus]
AMFILGLLGNTVLLFLIQLDSRLHKPMYYLLSQLSLLDVCFPLIAIPKVVLEFPKNESLISFEGCAAQIFFLTLMGVAEGVLLALMSYDRFVAVCHPLQYPVLMRNQVCLFMVASSWLIGMLNASIQTSVTLNFSYCASQAVDHFFCEMPALMKLSCSGTSIYELALSVSGVLILMLPLILIITSYSHILRAVLHMHSQEAQQKAFTTCS